jgi:hypothetical protein
MKAMNPMKTSRTAINLGRPFRWSTETRPSRRYAMMMLAITGASISPIRKMMKKPASNTTARPITCGSARWR